MTEFAASMRALGNIDKRRPFRIIPGETENDTNARWQRRRRFVGECMLSLARSLQMFCVWADLETSR